jgi:hypothetical protein
MNGEAETRPARKAMHRRVEDSLAYRLTMLRLKTRESRGFLELYVDELPLFVAIGALTDDEASAWRERFTLAAEAFTSPDSEVVGESHRARAREVLEEALSDYRESKPDSDTLSFWRFPAVLRTLKAVRAVSEDEAARWDRDFHEVLDEKSKPKREARQRAEREAQRGSPQDAKRYMAAELSRVVVGPPQRVNGVRVTCAELYEDCVVVRWHRVLSTEEISRGEKTRADQPTADELAAGFGVVLSLEDDLGTDYAPAMHPHEITGDKGTFRNDKVVPVWGRSVFVPAVPEGVKRMTTLNGPDEFEFELS